MNQVAKMIGIQFVPVITGFSKNSLKPVPTHDGILVTVASEPMIIEAYTNWAQEQLRKANLQRVKRITLRWEKLARHLLTKRRLEEKYG